MKKLVKTNFSRLYLIYCDRLDHHSEEKECSARLELSLKAQACEVKAETYEWNDR